MCAVAVLALGGGPRLLADARHDGPSVDALFVPRDFVAGLAVDRFDRLRVRRFGRIETRVAIHAAKRGMDGLLKHPLVDEEWKRASTPLHCQGLVTMAHQAVIRRLREHCRRKCDEQDEHPAQSGEQDSLHPIKVCHRRADAPAPGIVCPGGCWVAQV